MEVCEALNRLTPGDHDKRSALFNSGAEAVENAVKIARALHRRDAVVVFDHAYHGRTNLTMAMTAKNMPYKNGFGPFAGEIYRAPMSYPFREPAAIDGAEAPPRARSTMIEKQVGADNLAARRRSSRSRARAASSSRRRVPAALAEWCREQRRRLRRRRDPDRLRPHRRLVRLRARGRRAGPDHDRQGHRRRPAAGRRHRPRRDDGRRRTPAASAAPTAATRSPAPPRSARSTTIEQDDLAGAARRIEAIMRAAAARRWPADDPRIGDVRGRGAMMAIELVQPGTTEPDAALRRRGQRGLPRRRASSCSPAAPTATCSGSCRRSSIPDHLLVEGPGHPR